jgi:hypothetical protein
MFRVLHLIYHPRTETVSWLELGIARDMADAKRQFGGYPVLERIL